MGEGPSQVWLGPCVPLSFPGLGLVPRATIFSTLPTFCFPSGCALADDPWKTEWAWDSSVSTARLKEVRSRLGS